ncbi:MAG: 50S ribosomal protein L19 [Candidatus Bipolaricaulota bacterium]
MDDILRAVEQGHLRERGAFRPGDIVRVHERITEGAKERVQVFEGIVLKRSGGGTREMVTVRKISSGVGVEKTYPLHSPKVEKFELVKERGARQGRPYYLRDLRRIH